MGRPMILVTGLLVASCSTWEFKRVPPGQSLNVALAQKAIAVRLLSPPKSATSRDPGSLRMSFGPLPQIEEGELPTQAGPTEVNQFARGSACLQAGQIKEAVEAFEKVVKADPGFADAHYNLALAYQQDGQEAKSAEEFKKYKALFEKR